MAPWEIHGVLQTLLRDALLGDLDSLGELTENVDRIFHRAPYERTVRGLIQAGIRHRDGVQTGLDYVMHVVSGRYEMAQELRPALPQEMRH